MKDKEATMGKDPILDSRGLLCDAQQLRFFVHELACTLGMVLQASPLVAMALGPEVYQMALTEAVTAHTLACDEDKGELPASEDPTYRLFHHDD